MGNYSSIVENSTQDISTKITEISNANCITACLDADQRANITITDSTIAGINITNTCYVNGASCILKSSLDNTLINNQTNKQKGSIKDEEDPLDFLPDLLPSSSSINESNYQSISDSVTQMINSTCQNNSSVTGNVVNLNLTRDNVTEPINISNKGAVSKSQCVITNMAKNYVDNSQFSSQVASIVKESCLAGLGGFIGLLIMLFILKSLFHDKNDEHEDQKKKSPTPTTAGSKTTTTSGSKTPTTSSSKTPTTSSSKTTATSGSKTPTTSSSKTPTTSSSKTSKKSTPKSDDKTKKKGLLGFLERKL